MNRASLVKKLAAVFGGVALVAAFVLVGQASAVRQVPYELQPVTHQECLAFTMSRQADGQGGYVRVATWVFEVKDGQGNVRDTVTVSRQLTNGESNSLNGTINLGRDDANAQANL